MNKCLCGDPECRIEFGKCHCGCGSDTPIAPRNENRRGWVKGQPIIFIKGHASIRRKDLHVLTEIDTQNRRAVCDRCGPTTIKVNGDAWKCTGQLTVQHRLSHIDPDTKKAWCRGCLAEIDIVWKIDRRQASEGRWECLVRRQETNRDYRTQNREQINTYLRSYYKTQGRANRILKEYGLSQAEYDAKLAEQDGRCAICLDPPRDGFFLVVDHCHKTGKVRGLLCNWCNTSLGGMRDDPHIIQSALDYINHWNSLSP